VLNNINTDLVRAIEKYFSEKSAQSTRPSEDEVGDLLNSSTSSNTECVPAEQFGYLQAIDVAALEQLEKNNELRLKVEQKSGAYIAR
jgi:uncharacterized membrane protein